MPMPRIRLDVCFYYIIIAVLLVGLLFSKVQISIMQHELNLIKEDLRGSMIYKFPPKEGYEVEEVQPK